MNINLLVTALALLIGGIFSIATSSIATECYNNNSAFKDTKKDNYTFLIVNLVSAILTVLIAFSSMYMAATSF